MMTAETLVEIVDEVDEQTPLPEGWHFVSLESVIDEAQAGFAIGERDPKGVIQLRMNNVTTRGTFDWTSFIRVPASDELLNFYQLKLGDVLFNNTNSTELVGKTALFQGNDEPIVFSNHFTRLRTKRDSLAASYLTWWLLLQWHQKVFAVICDKWIGQSGIQKQKLLSLRINLPPTIEEQKRIAALLDEQMAAVAQARTAIETQLEAAQRLPNALLSAVFESEEAEDWEKRRLGEMAKTCSGTTPSRGNLDYYKGGIPWVKTGELKDGMILDTEEHISELALKETSLRLLPSETLLVAMYGQGQTRGRTGLLLTPATTNQACFAILPNETFDSRFLQFWFRYSYDRLRQETEGRGGNQPNLNGDVLNKQTISLPHTIDEQLKIVKRLNSQMQEVEALKKTLTEQLQAINKMPAALLRKAFAGEI